MKITGGDIGVFSIEKFAQRLGLNKVGGNRRKALGKMLELAGTDLKIKDLDDLVEVGRVLEGFEIPNVSSFIARRATIGGLGSIISAVVPGLAIVGGATWAGGTLLGIAMFLGGGKLMSAIISNPNSARALSKILDKEATTIVRRTATINALRIGIDEMDSYEELASFIKCVKEAGCNSFIIHARKAWLNGLSPKENREIPPLQYETVYQLKRDFSELDFIFNGGFTT